MKSEENQERALLRNHNDLRIVNSSHAKERINKKTTEHRLLDLTIRSLMAFLLCRPNLIRVSF
jgi:hypothetical protein